MLTKEDTVTQPDPRTKRTRQWIINAFGELLTEKTFDAITINDISERASVNRATFYNYFEDKYDLMEQAVNEMIRSTLYQHLEPDSDFDAGNLTLLIQTVCEFLDYLHAKCAPSNRKQFDSLVEQQVKSEVYIILFRWLDENKSNSPTANKKADLQATVTSWAIYGAAQKWLATPMHEPARIFADRVLPLIVSNSAFTA